MSGYDPEGAKWGILETPVGYVEVYDHNGFLAHIPRPTEHPRPGYLVREADSGLRTMLLPTEWGDSDNVEPLVLDQE